MTKREKSLICIICIAVLIFSITYSIYNSRNKPKIVSYEPYYICQGETLWSISKPISQATRLDIQSIVNEIEIHNGITANIKVGQLIEVPTYSIKEIK